jgi:hypothetical protein
MPDLADEIRDNLNKSFGPTLRTLRVMMGKMNGELLVSPESNLIWVTGAGLGAFQVINRHLPNRWGKMVQIGYDPNDLPNRLQVLGLADVYDDISWEGPGIPEHATLTHGFGKSDCLWVFREQILYCVPVPGQNKLAIYPDAKPLPNGTWWWTKTATQADYTAAIPATGAAICLVVLTAAGVIAFRTGTPKDAVEDLTGADFPELVTGDTGIVGLKLYAGMSELHHEPGNDDFIGLDQAGVYAATTSGIQELTGDVTATGPGVAVATIALEAVTNAKRAKMAPFTLSGNNQSTDAGPQDLTVAQIWAMGIGVFGGLSEDISSQVDGITDHFTISSPASRIWVIQDGQKQPDTLVTFTPNTAEFDLAWIPALGRTIEVIRLAPVADSVNNDYIYVRDEKPAGTNGGNFASGARRTRDINTEVADAGNHCTIAANQITLAAGTYRCLISAPAGYVDQNRIWLHNVTDNEDTLIGASCHSPNGGGFVSSISATLKGEFTISASKTFEIQHQCTTTFNTYGFGLANGFDVEIYTEAEFWKVA